MRNKLKRRKECKGVENTRENQRQPSEVIILPSTWSRCKDETSPEKASVSATAMDTNSCDAVEQQQNKNTYRATHTKIAPIFLYTRQLRKSKKSTPEKSVLYEKTQLEPVKSPQFPAQESHLAEREDFNLSTCSGQRWSSDPHSCLEEIQTSNPAFPVQTVFSSLQKKASQILPPFTSTAKCPSCLQPSHNHHKEKRKREHESFDSVPKRLKSSITVGSTVSTGHCPLLLEGFQDRPVISVKSQPRRSRLSHTYRLKQGSGRIHLVDNYEPNSECMNHRKSDDKSPITSYIPQTELCCEDVLWTDKYSPQLSSEVIGNSLAVDKLHCWLKKWKLRAERRKSEEKQRKEKSSDSWDCGDFQDEAGSDGGREEPLSNTMLITGPPGIGKTASVYGCALDLGFKVFEVNCSSQRSRRHVLSQLKEATQSHLVEPSGKDPLKPTFFNNYNTSSCPIKSDSLPAKPVALRNVLSTSKKRPTQNSVRFSRRGKANPGTAMLTNYFMKKVRADQLHFGGPSPSEKPDGKPISEPSPESEEMETQNKKTATSLILFEEVDVIFADDVGFLAAIKTFMSTTKRPVILTTNDPFFRERFSYSLEELVFKTPSVVDVCSYLQLVCLAENVKLDLDDVQSLFRLTQGDVRRCLLQLQLWANSCGAQAINPSDPSGCEGCVTTMLGLQSISKNYLLHLLNHQFWTEAQLSTLLHLLVESWRRAVPLLYSNLELLLPSADEGGPVLDMATCSGTHSELADSDKHMGGEATQQSTFPSSSSIKNVSRLSRRKYISTSFNCAQKTSRISLNGTHQRAQSSDHKPKQRANICLSALTDFFDVMSYLDATLPAASPLDSDSEGFFWTGAEIQEGLLDELTEDERSCRQGELLDIKASVEALGFHRCWWKVSEVWTEAQRCRQDAERLTITAFSKKQSLSFSFRHLCPTNVFTSRYELNRVVLSSQPFSLLGKRQAVSVDYMPLIRFICRSHEEKKQQQKRQPVGCLKYLKNLHLGLSKSTVQLLAEDFS